MHSYSVPTLLLLVAPTCWAIECYTGLKLIAGQSIGAETIQCDNSNAQCYNMTANTGALIDVAKAGCSLWRCMLARDRCISTVFHNIPISLCCCSTNRCNIGGSGGFQKQVLGGWNAEPEHHQEVKKQWTQDEVARKFNSSDLDDDVLGSTTRTHRHSTQAKKQWTKDEVARKFNSSDFGEDVLGSNTLVNTHSTQVKKQSTKVATKSSSSDLDVLSSTTQANRHSSQEEIQIP